MVGFVRDFWFSGGIFGSGISEHFGTKDSLVLAIGPDLLLQTHLKRI
jgi:hypothetical protein